MDSTSTTFSLSAAEISRWQEQCAEIDGQIDRLKKDKVAIEDRLRAAQLLAPSLFILAQPLNAAGRGQSIVRKGLLTWPHIIEEAVRNSGSGIRQRDLLENVRHGRHGKRLTRGESGYYNAIQTVLRKKMVIKHGEWLFTPAQHQEYLRKVGAGEIEDYAENTEFGSPGAAEAARFIAANPGAKAIDIIKHIWAAQKAGGRAQSPKNSLYNMLARLAQQNKLMKDEKGGYLPYKENEAPTEAGAPDAGRVAALPFENVVGFRQPR
jgi:hypothetical protein